MTTLAIDEVHFSYKAKRILHDISFDISGGEVVGLLGPNGSGKSTVTKLAARVLKPGKGRVAVDGVDIARIPRREHARRVAYVPQATVTPFELSVREAVMLGRTPHYLLRPASADLARVDAALASLGLDELAERRVSELSGGQAQRVAIARAIAQKPGVLLMDEPTSALDLRFQIETLRTVRRLASEDGVGVLVAIHDLNHAAALCDRIVLLVNGRVHSIGSPRDILTAAVIEEVYGVVADVTVTARSVEIRVTP
ncbi:ABC transporter ATP-binding protein [Actinacidiphila sp. ITFR-21]|uniref:ABC transporter ATP-binding protein n=1 Tax=Actinacidiphila sp. ITFR-21 TaxID=3075199 RepID=UPI00288AAF12|nr:ABC transporter ATP-binding protein [Streptomyces sp. ITFR-21]WNI18044.1 ABC transporter ATP-binding protein [Streptomyces sp. ITFR-21]